MTEGYDYTDDLETLQRINQANSAAGTPALMPEDLALNSAQADVLNRNMSLTLPYDTNPLAQRMAAWMKSWYLLSEHTWEIDSRWCPEYDEVNPDSFEVAALVYSTYVPLQSFSQYREVAESLLCNDFQCRAHFTEDCCFMSANKFLAVSLGDYICLFQICTPCRKALDTSLTVDSPKYLGIDGHWMDSRVGEPRQHPWSPWDDNDDPWSQPDSNDEPPGFKSPFDEDGKWNP